MSVFDTHQESLDADDSQTLRSQRVWKEASDAQELDFEGQRLRNRLRAKMFNVDAAPVTIGRFAVLERMGAGGMGVVYSAYDEELDRRVAVKLLQTSREDDASVGKSRLLREAQALAKLSHPNVVQIYEVGTFDGRVFLAMEFLAGPDLRGWLLDEPRPWEVVLRHFVDAGKGLAAAHREGIIHRDFKPANVLFGVDGRARVVDFGLARASEHARVPQTVPSGETNELFAVELTQTGEIMGTPAYMSPEQARHEGVDARSDQYSFCVSLYEALFGRRPHQGSSTAEVLVAVAEGKVEPPPRTSKIPARVVRAVMRGLSPEPSERFADMDALLAELSPQRTGRRWRWIGGSGLVAAVSLGMLLDGGQAACASFERALGDAWSDARREEVQTMIAQSGVSNAEATAARTVEHLDSYAQQWLAARTEACEIREVRREESPELNDLRVGCLVERRVELDALTHELAAGDPVVVEHAVRAASELSPLSTCEDPGRLERDPAAEQELEPVRHELARAQALYKAGRYDRALELIGAAERLAVERGSMALEAAALFHAGVVHERRVAYPLGVDVLERAIDLAEAADDDHLAAQVWILLAVLHADLDRDDLAQRALRRARSALHRLGDEDRPELLSARAVVAWRGGRYEAAETDQRAALVGIRELYGEHHPKTADALRRLASILSDAGSHDEAQRIYQEALVVYELAFGKEHPDVAKTVLSVGVDHFRAGRDDRAVEALHAAERLYQAVQGPDAPALLMVHKALADIAVRKGELDEATRRVERLLDTSARPDASPFDRPDALWLAGYVASERGERERATEFMQQFLEQTDASPLAESYRLERLEGRVNLADKLLALGKIQEADAQLQRVQVELAQLPPEHAALDQVANVRANVWLFSGKCAQARGESGIDAFEDGLRSWPEISELDEVGAATQARLRWALARAVAPTDPARAHELAELARPHLAEPEASEAGAWLASQPRTDGA